MALVENSCLIFMCSVNHCWCVVHQADHKGHDSLTFFQYILYMWLFYQRDRLNTTYWRRQWWEQSTGVKSHIHPTRPDAPTPPTPPTTTVCSTTLMCTTDTISAYCAKNNNPKIFHDCSICVYTIQKHFTATLNYSTSHLNQTHINQHLSPCQAPAM